MGVINMRWLGAEEDFHGIMMDWALHNCGAGPWHGMSESYKV